jgi:RNA polymerase sigma-70 factor (ECF subfamily)
MELHRDEYVLALKARDGDREALATLVEQTRSRLFALAYAELRHYDDAQDAVAAALVQICRHIGTLREPERVRAWMQAVVRNEAHRILRRRAGAPISLEPIDWSPAAADTASELRLDVERALRRLPRDQARAVALYYIAQVSVGEIARRIDRPVGTIKRWLHEGRRHLATELEGYAPMAPTTAVKIAILSSDPDPKVIERLVDAARAAGYANVVTLTSLPPLEVMGEGEAAEFHVPEALKGTRLVLLDDPIGGRSAFELLILLKATVEAKGMSFFLLSSGASDSTVLAAHLVGVDCFLTKPYDLAEVEKFLGRLREMILGSPAAA